MQIDRYNHLLFPRDPAAGNNPPAMGKDVPPSATGAPGALAKPQATRRPEGVVLNIQWPGGDIANAPDPGVYTDGRKTVASFDADTSAMARDHQLAVDRNAGSFTQISLNKDGVLVANKPQTAAQDKQPDFVALAVSAMREYSDAHEREKVRTTPDVAAAPPEAPWSTLKQFAAKLNVFA